MRLASGPTLLLHFITEKSLHPLGKEEVVSASIWPINGYGHQLGFKRLGIQLHCDINQLCDFEQVTQPI